MTRPEKSNKAALGKVGLLRDKITGESRVFKSVCKPNANGCTQQNKSKVRKLNKANTPPRTLLLRVTLVIFRRPGWSTTQLRHRPRGQSWNRPRPRRRLHRPRKHRWYRPRPRSDRWTHRWDRSRPGSNRWHMN
jgi:hypothetical protein